MIVFMVNTFSFISSVLLTHSVYANTEICQKKHLVKFNLTGFKAILVNNEHNEKKQWKYPCDNNQSNCDLYFRARFLGTEQHLMFYNEDNQNTLTKHKPTTLNHSYDASNETLTLQIQFVEIDDVLNNPGKIFFDVEQNKFHGIEMAWQKNHTIETTNRFYLIEDSIDQAYRRQTYYGYTNITYTAEVLVKREDCLTTQSEGPTTFTSMTSTVATSVSVTQKKLTTTSHISKLKTSASPRCQLKGDACNSASCCNTTCGGFSDQRGRFKSCGIETPEVGPGRLLIATDRSPYTLYYPVTEAHLNNMVDQCDKLDGYLSCDDQRMKRSGSRSSSSFRSFKATIQNIPVELQIPIPQYPKSCSNLANYCKRDEDCCFDGIGFGRCDGKGCHVPKCRKVAELCSTNDECCSQQCQFEWSVSGGHTGKRCSTKPKNEKCSQDDQCRSLQCCKAGREGKRCFDSICPNMLSMIDEAFNQMGTNEDEEPEGQGLKYHVTMIATIILSSVVVSFMLYWQLQATKLIVKSKKQTKNN